MLNQLVNPVLERCFRYLLIIELLQFFQAQRP